MNVSEMTTERDRCKAAALAAASTLRTTELPDYERLRLVSLVHAYSACVDALNVGIAGGANATRDPLLDAAKGALNLFETRTGGAAVQYVQAAQLEQVRAYARAAQLA